MPFRRVAEFAIALILFAVHPLPAQTLGLPIAGITVDPRGQLVAVPGVPGNLMNPQAIPVATSSRILSSCFPGSVGAIKTEDAVIVLNANGESQARFGAAGGDALFVFDPSGSLQWVVYPGARRIENPSGTESVDATPLGDEIVAVAWADSGRMQVLARSGTQLWSQTFSVSDGAISGQTRIDGHAPAVFFQSGWLTTKPGELLWSDPKGSSETLHVSVPNTPKSLATAGPRAISLDGAFLLTPSWKVLEIPARLRSMHREVHPQ